MTELINPSRRMPRSLGKVLGGLLLVLLGVFVGRYVVPVQGEVAPLRLSVSEDGQRQFVFPAFWETWDALHQEYIGDIDDTDLFYGAVAGMVRAVDDPYTIFSDPEDSKQFRETLEGQFSGIGVEIGVRGGLVRVIAPLEGSPAQQAGIKAGDIIVSVDDLALTPDTSIDEVVRAIRGPEGEAVILSIARQEEETTETHEITVVRDTITVESVILERLEGNIVHVRVTSFNGDTTEQFTAVVRQLANEKPAGIILDVRNNPGGFLQTAVDIAGNFLNPNTLVVTERGEKETKHVTKGLPQLSGIPLVVLINEGSASASEIIAGALADQLQTPLVGEKSFGKGSVQELIPFKDGSSLRVTVAKWFTPSGRSIDDEGVEPTIAIEDNDETETDEQLEAAVQELNKAAS